MKRYYFTNDKCDNILDDYLGNIRGARTYAQRIANSLQQEIYINDCASDDIVDLINPLPLFI